MGCKCPQLFRGEGTMGVVAHERSLVRLHGLVKPSVVYRRDGPSPRPGGLPDVPHEGDAVHHVVGGDKEDKGDIVPRRSLQEVPVVVISVVEGYGADGAAFLSDLAGKG